MNFKVQNKYKNAPKKHKAHLFRHKMVGI